MARNLRLPSGVGSTKVKGEMGDAFPGKFGLRHVVPTARDVLHFYDKMMHCTESDRERKWFKHLVQYLVVLVGYDFIHEFGPDALTTFGWIAFSRMLVSKDGQMYGKFKIRWRHLIDIRFVEHLMNNYDSPDYDFLASMMDEQKLGYKIQWAKKFELDYVKKHFAYEVISMKGKYGELPSFMIEEVLS
ncbi:hypothetical protein D1007_29471 [Hordeum vulgare]|nr:hypothetical protein D1007_29471 [Hordeum vulgare]